MSFTYRPAKRQNTPLIIGLAGPTKSGKTYSAHRIAKGLAQGGPIAMLNAEGPKGHQYADTFDYLGADIRPPYRPARYTEALKDALALEPKLAVLIIDSMSHMHDGPGGLLEFHAAELDRLAGNDQKQRDKKNWTAWIKPKAEENEFIYEALSADCHMIWCFRAKEKLKIVTGKAPIELGWQPIAGERIAFETIFTLTLPPHSKGRPDLAISEMREPFDSLIKSGEQLSEETGASLAAWAAGTQTGAAQGPQVHEAQIGATGTGGASDYATDEEIAEFLEFARARGDENLKTSEKAIEAHRKKNDGRVRSSWLDTIRQRLAQVAPEPVEETLPI